MQFLWSKIYLFFTYSLFTIGNFSVSLLSTTQLILLLILVFIIARLQKNLFKNWILVKLNFDVGSREAIAILIFYFVSTIGILIVLEAMGFNLASLIVIFGGLGIGIGLSLQKIIVDLISGILLLLRRSIKIDDFIEFGGRQEFVNLKGTIIKISLLSTIVKTKDGASLIVPNSYLVNFPILNWSYEHNKNRLKIPISVNKNTDFVLFCKTVLSVAYLETGVLHEPQPKLIFQGFGDNYCQFEIQIWMEDIRNEDAIKNSFNYALDYGLSQRGIEVNYPQELLVNTSLSSSILPLSNNYHYPDSTGIIVTPYPKTIDSLNRQALSMIMPLSNDYHHADSTGTIITPYPKTIDINRKALSIRDLLKQISFFEKMTDLELRKVIEYGYRQQVHKSVILFNEGDPGDAFYIILEGAVEVFVPKMNKHLATLTSGAFFGELSLILGIPRTASVRILEPTIFFVLDKQGFQKLLQERFDLAEVIIKELENRREELIQRQQELRAMGMIDPNEDDINPIDWVRKRLIKLVSIYTNPS